MTEGRHGNIYLICPWFLLYLQVFLENLPCHSLSKDSPMSHGSLFFLITFDRTRGKHMTFAGSVRYCPLRNLKSRPETNFLNYRNSSFWDTWGGPWVRNEFSRELVCCVQRESNTATVQSGADMKGHVHMWERGRETERNGDRQTERKTERRREGRRREGRGERDNDWWLWGPVIPAVPHAPWYSSVLLSTKLILEQCGS